MDFINDIRLKKCELRVLMSSVPTQKSSIEIYAPHSLFGGWWFIGKVESERTLKDFTPNEVLKDLERNYIESEMTCKILFEMEKLERDYYLKD